MAQADIPKNPVNEYNGVGLEKQYGEISDIRSDLESLKENVLSLTRHIQADSKEKAAQVTSVISEGIDTLLDKSDKGMHLIEENVKENPRRSVLIAFLAGFALNLLMRKG